MSNINVANIIFTTSAANRIDYVSGNINITSANIAITSKLVANSVVSSSYYDSSNTSYYTAPSGKSAFHTVKVTKAQLTPGAVTYLSKNGYNNAMIVVDGKLYTSSGGTSVFASNQTGRGLTGTSATEGFMNFKLVNFPGETGTLTKAGHVGTGASYALFSTGNLYTWGYNGYGTCGLGSTSAIGIPTLAATSVSQVYDHYTNSDPSGGYGRLFIKKTDNYIYGTGYNGYGQLGSNNTTQLTSFTQLTGWGTTVKNVYPIGGQYGFTFFQKNDNSIWACGYNGQGQLGNATTVDQSTPVDVTTNWGGTTGSAREIKKVVAGSAYNNAVSTTPNGWAGIFLDDGSTSYFRMSGYNAYGQLGDGTIVNKSTPVTPNVNGYRISDVCGSGGSYGSIILLTDIGQLWHWGYNGYGQIGDGVTTNRTSPGVVYAGTYSKIFGDWTQTNLSNQAVHYIISTNAGNYNYGMGKNTEGQVGNGSTTSPVLTADYIRLPSDFYIADMGSTFTGSGQVSMIALSTDGRLYAWGHNGYNSISYETTNNIPYPIPINLPLGG
jgi:alpha-tubulin suppressor-like RCC1 family protein